MPSVSISVSLFFAQQKIYPNTEEIFSLPANATEGSKTEGIAERPSRRRREISVIFQKNHSITMNKKGQSTVEFLLVLGTVITLLFTFMVLFNEQIAARFFWIVGGILG